MSASGEENLNFLGEFEKFTEAVRNTRGEPGLSLQSIAGILKHEFTSEELETLIKLIK